MSGYLIDTLIWTGALIALVLVLRRPVSRHLGAGAAYGLWLLPMARLVMPPLVLPAWLAPTEVAPVPALDMPAADFVPVSYDTGTAMPLATPYPAEAFDWETLLIAVWLMGAAVFLIRRYALYFRMRRELLADARPVGNAGRIRFVESPTADGPVAFGVIDKVIALPLGFMANSDRMARDLALAHELAHHRGRDLLANMIVQPLFALHWFTPLGIYGWQAMRRDQEAACDGRVIAGRPREARAAYAEVIARFAKDAAPTARLALAAPMACPVLGDRSIVHRLKALAMTDPTRRRRWSGRLLLAGAALTLPLTASISYAADDMVMPPAPPAPPEAPIALPAPPAWDHEAAHLDDIDAELARIESGEGRRHVWIERTRGDDGKERVVRIVRTRDRDGKEHVERRAYVVGDRHELTEQEREEIEERVADARERAADAREKAAEARERAAEAREKAAERQEWADEMREARVDSEAIRREVTVAIAEANGAVAEARAYAPRVRVGCRSGQREVSETATDSSGRETIFICQSVAYEEARRGLNEARREVSRDRDLSASERATALRAIDEAMRGLPTS